MIHSEFPAMPSRLQIAASHFKENCNRQQAVNRKIEKCVSYANYKKGVPTLFEMKVHMTFDYARDVQSKVTMVIARGSGDYTKETFSSMTSKFELKAKADVIASHRSSFK